MLGEAHGRGHAARARGGDIDDVDIAAAAVGADIGLSHDIGDAAAVRRGHRAADPVHGQHIADRERMGLGLGDRGQLYWGRIVSARGLVGGRRGCGWRGLAAAGGKQT